MRNRNYYDPYIWKKITSFENLFLAFRKAAKGRRSRSSVAEFELDVDENLLKLKAELEEGSYQPGGYLSFHIHDPKKRLISAAPFRDRVVHHALVNLIEPAFDRKFIYDTYANRKGKGTHKALDRATKFMRRFNYVLPMDIRQYFPSIDHEILLANLFKTIQEPRTKNLCSQIVASGQGVLHEEYEMVFFPDDTLFAASRPRGLPIGNLTSQIFANIYLSPLDHFIKRKLKCEGYLRYVDDMLLFANSKKELHLWRKEIVSFLAKLRLTIHENSAQLRPVHTGVPFLGFQIFPEYRRLKRRKAIHARRRLKALFVQYQAGEIDEEKVHASIQAWIAHAEHGDTCGLRKNILSQIAFQGVRLGS